MYFEPKHNEKCNRYGCLVISNPFPLFVFFSSFTRSVQLLEFSLGTKNPLDIGISSFPCQLLVRNYTATKTRTRRTVLFQRLEKIVLLAALLFTEKWSGRAIRGKNVCVIKCLGNKTECIVTTFRDNARFFYILLFLRVRVN